ncbi:MAG TPA: hypothetical protein VFO81_02170, partial [Gaiellaceae bacterium]|nr:hypothetical protein [Gaiellaceae bacterium]
PYADDGAPTVRSLRATRGGAVVRRTRLAGTVDLVAEAVDATPLPVPAPWTGRPVTPALLRWRVVASGGSPMSAWVTAADFRLRIPDDSDFSRIYARWTRQNLARRDGRYRFHLARGWDTTTVANGAYLLVVSATDVRGNSRSARFPIRVANG